MSNLARKHKQKRSYAAIIIFILQLENSNSEKHGNDIKLEAKKRQQKDFQTD